MYIPGIYYKRLIINGFDSGLPPPVLLFGYDLALRWCKSYLEDEHCEVRGDVDWARLESVLALVRGVVGKVFFLMDSNSTARFIHH